MLFSLAHKHKHKQKKNKHVRFSCAYAYAYVLLLMLMRKWEQHKTNKWVRFFLCFCLCLRLCRGCSHLLCLCYAYALMRISFNGIKHIRSAPYHLATNVRLNVLFKHSNKLFARQYLKGSLSQKLANFLLAYRTTPQTTTGETQAIVLTERNIRIRLAVLKQATLDPCSMKSESHPRQFGGDISINSESLPLQ